MKWTTKLFSLLLVLTLVLVPTGSVAAAGLMEGKVIFAGTFTLASGETLTGDLVIFGGTGTVEAGATVDGATVLVGGNLAVDGEVMGDVVVVGGAVSLGSTAVVHGNLTTVGAALYQADGAVIRGEVFNTATSHGPSVDVTPNIPTVPSPPMINPVDVRVNLFNSAMALFFRAVMLGLLAALLAVFMPEQMQRVSQAVLTQPAVAGGMGLLTIVAIPVGMLIMAVTIILIPVAALVLLVWLLAMLFGWIALGSEIGARLARTSTNPWPVWLSAGLGTFLLTLLANGIGEYIWCVGWIVPFIVSMLGLGGVVMTRFGTQVALPPVVITAPAPPTEA